MGLPNVFQVQIHSWLDFFCPDQRSTCYWLQLVCQQGHTALSQMRSLRRRDHPPGLVFQVRRSRLAHVLAENHEHTGVSSCHSPLGVVETRHRSPRRPAPAYDTPPSTSFYAFSTMIRLNRVPEKKNMQVKM